MLHHLSYSITFNKSEEKFRIVCYCLPVCFPSSFSNFSVELICFRIVVFVCLDKSMPMTLNGFDDINNLISFLLDNHRFLIFQQVFHTLLACFLSVDKKIVYCRFMH